MPETPTAATARPLVILNVDGPDLVVVLDGNAVADVLCGGDSVSLDPADQALPALPWSLEFRRTGDDGLVGVVAYDGLSEDRFVTVRGESLFVGPMLGVGPAPEPSACP